MSRKKNPSRKLSALQVALIGRIVDYVRDQNLPVGHHLTEPGLGKAFGVSRSPIRTALQYLASRGIIEVRPNHGFFLAREASQIGKDALDLPQHDDDRFYMRVADDRRRGELPDHFTVSHLTRRYRTNRSSVARVLKKLAADGIIRRSEGHGWDFTMSLRAEEDEKASYRFRLAIEPASLLDPAFKIDPVRLEREKQRHLAFLKRMPARAGRKRAAATGLDPEATIEAFEMNADFHNMLASFSGNRFFIEAMKQQNNMRRLAEYSYLKDSSHIPESCEQHLAIIEALQRGDNEWAANLMRQHLKQASGS